MARNATHIFAVRSLCCTLLVGLWCYASAAYSGQPLELGDRAPDWILQNSQGDYVSFYRDSGDRAAVLLFWASWCRYCAELLPELAELKQQLDKDDVKFYAINIWEDGNPVAYFNRHDYNFTLLLKGDMVAKRYDVSSTPGLIVVDADKTVRYIRAKNTPPEQACDDVKNTLVANGAAP